VHRLTCLIAAQVRGFAKGAGGVGLFPGAIVALRGKNGGGGAFSVSEILAVCFTFFFLQGYPQAYRNAPQNPPLPSAKSSGKLELESSAEDAFSMFVASGPFTADSDLKYKPWRSLLEVIRSARPAVTLLVRVFLRHGCLLYWQEI
jgi:DNA polymerase alpha subunit B